jgi:hypothetical protein
MLTTSERIHLKERVIDKLGGQLRRNIDLTLDEYGFKEADFQTNSSDYVLARIGRAPDEKLEALDRHLFPERYSDEEPPMATLLGGEDNTPFSQQEQAVIADLA